MEEIKITKNYIIFSDKKIPLNKVIVDIPELASSVRGDYFRQMILKSQNMPNLIDRTLKI